MESSHAVQFVRPYSSFGISPWADDLYRELHAFMLSPFNPSMLRLWTLISSLVFGLSHASVLVDFQVSQPPNVPHDTKQCTIPILKRDFAFSYGSSEIVTLTPPTDCGALGSWAAITLNFTVTSNGTQYDRLGIFTYRNVEIWRTSTPEPTRGDGIVWTYIKDVTKYTPLFTERGTFILELDNIIQPGLDGVYSTVLEATFYASSSRHPAAKKADVIIPISTMLNDTGNDASVPPSFTRSITFPKNTVKVFAELLASGNGQEEQWYCNAANEFYSDAMSELTMNQGPYREVRLLVDGQLAGSALPYPVVFTGGFVPSSWRPIAAYGALDLPTYFLDLTPFVPILVDGKPHNLTIDVVSAETDHVILQNWYVSGLLQVVTDPSGKPTTGNIVRYSGSPYAVTKIYGAIAKNGDVGIVVEATRNLRIESNIVSGSGEKTRVVWNQALQYRNEQHYLHNTSFQVVRQTATGTMSSTHNGETIVSDTFSYPFDIDFHVLTPEFRNWTANIDHSYIRTVKPNPFVVQSTISSHQTTTGFYQLQTGGNFGNGTCNNTFSYADVAGNTYTRRVNAAYNVITLDQQGGTLAPPRVPATSSSAPFLDSIYDSSPGARIPAGRKSL